MPIRKRISDPYGFEYKEMARRRRDGPLPETPRKPKLEERQPFVTALGSIPVGKVYRLSDWRVFTDPFLERTFMLWGVELNLWPAAKPTMSGGVECIGVLIIQKTKLRRGICPKITLKGDNRHWYRNVLDWIAENNYGG